MWAAPFFAVALTGYLFFLPGDRTWCWTPASGAVDHYELEVTDHGREVVWSANSPAAPEPCETAWFANGDYDLRVVALDIDGESGPFSEPYLDYGVRGGMDCNGDGIIGIADFNCLRTVFGLCLDDIGYFRCTPP